VGPNRRAQDRERAAAEAAIKAKRAETQRSGSIGFLVEQLND
jgi:hypothetical protein